jgi:hypothetical protein
MDDLLILSYANKETINSVNYINSLKKYKYNYKVVGDGETWVNFITKIKACYNYLITEIKYNLICLTDTYDVLCCGPKQELINKFKTFKKDIVFSTENNCVKGQCIYLNNYYKQNKKLLYPYLNAGFYMGKKDKIIELLKFILDTSIKTGIVDDQFLCCVYVQQFPNNVALDNDCKLIATICYNVLDYKWNNNRVYNIKTQQKCCFLHSPNMNSDLSYRLDYYGKRILKDKYKRENFINRLIKFFKHVKSNLTMKLYFIIGILILLIITYFNRKIGLLILIILIVVFLYFFL